MNRYELGIVDTRNIIKILDDVYSVDFKNYALTFFKRRVENFIKLYNFKDAEGFIQKIEKEKDFFELFMRDLCVETTEMFRDPSVWRLLREDILPKNVFNTPNFKIWLPEISSGEELFSLVIVLKKLKLLENVQIIGSTISELHLERIKSGIFDPKKIETNDANYSRIFSEGQLTDYYTLKEDKAYWDVSLIENVKLTKQNIIFDDYPKGTKLILFRNQMIYYNQILQERFMKIMYNSLVPGGHLLIGNNERIEYWNSEKDYVLVSDTESIYKKRLS
jgi:chemotaxis protein methyltransferase CheR